MTLITEKNISKIIIYVFIIIMTLMILSISYFYVKNSYKEFDKEIENFKNEYYEKEKETIKKEVDMVIDIINYIAIKSDTTNEESEAKKETIRLMHNISFQERKSNYIFIYEVLDINGGDKFAKMVVNPNRPDLLGEYLSTNYKDANGKKFREDFLKDIREKGFSYTQYAYKKPYLDDQPKQKLSYFKYVEKWNWIVAVGVYLEDIDQEIDVRKKRLKNKLKVEISQTLFLFLLFLGFAIVLSILVSQKIDDVLKEYQKKVKKNSDELIELNKTLEKRVQEELNKNREQEQILIQKSKFIALGEMISNIAHQWRQPLSELSSLLMSIKFKYEFGKLDETTMIQKSKDAEKLIEYMSHTIDDFRNFFIPKKEIREFYLYKSIDNVLFIIGSAIKNNGIELDIQVEKDIIVNSYQNEYEQVILNILSNAKDTILLRQIENGIIKVYAYSDDKYVRLSIEDNAGGILIRPKSKIFEPYFTTKADSNGTGIGLYMSKIIIEKNMKGKLKVRNTSLGAKFEIILPK